MGKMGERLMVHPASVTNAIRRLEKRGLVQRQLSADDRRIVLATITEDGRAMARSATTALNHAEFGLSGITRQQAAELTSMLQAIRTAAGDLARGTSRLGASSVGR
jgi:DNA-binding MarR family transcriptional regulator